MSKLGERVRILRKSRGWSAQRLSDELDGLLSRSVISGLETGRKQDLSFEAGVTIAKIFGMTAEELLTGDAVAALHRADIEARLAEATSTLEQLKSELQNLDERSV